MEQWAPSWTAEEWDRVGLLAGDPRSEAGRAWVALELTPELLDQALAAGVDLLLTHHPPIFKPLNDLRLDKPATARLVKAAAGGLALFAAHTNLDAAPGGVNDALAGRLGLRETETLAPVAEKGLAKLVTFVPPDHLEAVARALFAAGAGRIGAYRECAFHTPGIGSFTAPPDGRPFVGRAGQRETVAEERLETLLPLAAAGAALRALKQAHPYEEPAYDLYPLRQPPAGFGLGRVGNLPAPQGGEEFLAAAARELGSEAAQATGPLPAQVERVAVVGGSGGDFLAQAAAAGAQVLVTGEAGYHAWEQAGDLGICLAVLGHYHTEAVIIEPWARRLGQSLRDAGLFCDMAAWTHGAAPWRPVSARRGG